MNPKMAKSGALSLWLLIIFLQTVLLIGVATPKTIVETVPGFSGTLPFKLETGYVGVGNGDDRQLFYYFIESERDPLGDPLLLWLTGGPGCSGLSTLARNVGPLQFDDAYFGSGIPTFKLNPYSWTKFASIIFIDAPVGSGFSYSSSSEGWYTSDTKNAQDNFDFIRKWLKDHPKFDATQLYVVGESYAGAWTPVVALKITEALENGDKLFKNFKGYVLGNPLTSLTLEVNSRVEYAHHMALISDQLYQATKLSCNGSYIDVDEDNIDCLRNLELYTKCVSRVNIFMVLEPACSKLYAPSKGNLQQLQGDTGFSNTQLIQMPHREELECRNQLYVFFPIWANDPDVRKALHIRNGTVLNWERRNLTIAFDYDVNSTIEYHRNLTTRPFRALIFSGDHDMGAPYFATHRWITSLNMMVTEPWRPWFVDNQVAGYTEKFLSTDLFHLTYATVLGGGHTAPEYKPQQCFEMADKWFSRSDL